MNRQGWRDTGLAAGVAVLALGGSSTATTGRLPLDLSGVGLVVVGALALAARRWVPRVVLGVTAACLLVYLVCGYPGVSVAVPVMVALYGTVRAGRRLTAGLVIAAILVGGVAGEAGRVGDAP